MKKLHIGRTRMNTNYAPNMVNFYAFDTKKVTVHLVWSNRINHNSIGILLSQKPDEPAQRSYTKEITANKNAKPQA